MEKTICWANTDDFEQSEIVILGIPDESQSHALRKGASEAPHFIREISNLRDSYTRERKKSLGLPFNGVGKKKKHNTSLFLFLPPTHPQPHPPQPTIFPIFFFPFFYPISI